MPINSPTGKIPDTHFGKFGGFEKTGDDMISNEETLLLLRKWKEEAARLRVVLKLDKVSFDLECKLIAGGAYTDSYA